jgi:hypothetical protein
MKARQTLFAVLLVLAASCGGGGGSSNSNAAEPEPSYALLAFNVDGNVADIGGAAAFDSSQGTPWSLTLQFATNTEARRVRIYLSGDDILGDTGVGNAPGNPNDLAFYDEIISVAQASVGPVQLPCSYAVGSKVLACNSDTGSAQDRDTWTSGNSLDAFMIVRACSVALPGRCDVWPVPVHFVF